MNVTFLGKGFKVLPETGSEVRMPSLALTSIPHWTRGPSQRTKAREKIKGRICRLSEIIYPETATI